MPVTFWVVSVSGALVLSALFILGKRLGASDARFAEEVKTWPMIEATIQVSSAISIGRNPADLPCFHYSYVIAGEYYSGCFGLHVYGDRAATLRKEMINRRFMVCYDPNQPSRNFFPEDTVEGYKVIRVPE